MNVFRKASLAVVGLAITLTGLTMVTAVEATAATACASENQAAGAARNDMGHKRQAYEKTKKRLKKATKAYRRHHTKANRKSVRKAKRAKSKARARYRASIARYDAANAKARRCNSGSSPTRPATSRDVVSSIRKSLTRLGVPQEAIDQLQPALGPLGDALAGTPVDQLQPVADQVSSALAGGADPSALTGAINTFSDALTQAGVPADTLSGPLTDLIGALASGNTDPATYAALAQEIADALSRLAPSPGGSPLDPSLLLGLIHQITDPLTQAGIPANTIADAIAQGLAQIPTDRSQVPSDPAGLIDLVVGGVENALAGTPADQLNSVLEQIRAGLGGLLGSTSAISGLPL